MGMHARLGTWLTQRRCPISILDAVANSDRHADNLSQKISPGVMQQKTGSRYRRWLDSTTRGYHEAEPARGQQEGRGNC